MTGAYPAPVFIIVPVEHVVTTLDAPMATVNREQTLRDSFFRPPTRDAVGYFTGGFTTFFLRGLPLNHEGLPYMREVEVVIELGGGPYLS